MSSVVINGDTSGSVTLSAPAVAGSTTLTLPTTSGTVLTSASSLTASMPAGSVIQTVTSLISTGGSYATTTSNTLTSASHAVTITPQFSTSKILVICTGHAIGNLGSGSNIQGIFTLYRGGTNLASGGGNSGFAGIYMTGSAASYIGGTIGMNVLDSPATTSATTYTVYFACASGNSLVYVGTPGIWAYDQAVLTAMEIR